MKSIKIISDKAKADQICEYYKGTIINNPKNKYEYFIIQIDKENKVLAYKKENPAVISITFTGNNCEEEASIFFDESLIPEVKESVPTNYEDLGIQIGSDEVGVGDFFLGFYVCAVYLNRNDIQRVLKLNIKDSKKLKDGKIIEIAENLLKCGVKYKCLNATAAKINSVSSKMSTHEMLAKLHNSCHQYLISKYKLDSDIIVYVDQFAESTHYLKYAKDQLIENQIIFKTKGESYYPSIACASILARYFFLKDWEKLEKHFGMTIPKGAGASVDLVYKTLKFKFGNEVDNYVKHLFRNYRDNNSNIE